MSAPSAYPRPLAEVVAAGRALVAELGRTPSQREVRKHLRVGAPRAREVLAQLDETAAADLVATVPPDGPEPATMGQTTTVGPTCVGQTTTQVDSEGVHSVVPLGEGVASTDTLAGAGNSDDPDAPRVGVTPTPDYVDGPDGDGRRADEGTQKVRPPADRPGRGLSTDEGTADRADRPVSSGDGSADEGSGLERTPAEPLETVAAAVAAELAGAGVPVTRDRLAGRMRDRGHRVSTERAGVLLRTVRT